jgi:hypothetical protein
MLAFFNARMRGIARSYAILLSEDAIQSMRAKATILPGDLAALIETALAVHRFRSILKRGVMVQNIKNKGLSHTNHYRQIEAEFWEEAREAVKKPGELNAADTLIESLEA